MSSIDLLPVTFYSFITSFLYERRGLAVSTLVYFTIESQTNPTRARNQRRYALTKSENLPKPC